MLNLSTEFFPLTAPAPLEQLSQTWSTLRQAGVSEYSLTFGALGSAQDKSTTCLKYLRLSDKSTSPVMHLTCRNQTWAKLDRRLAAWKKLGVRRVLALKGDDFSLRNDGPNSSVELVEFLSERGFQTSVAAYPDGHPDARNPAYRMSEQDWLQRKIDAGADQVVTQFSSGTDGLLRLRDQLSDRAPHVRLKAGLMPIPAWDRYTTLIERCGIDQDPGEAVLFDALPEDSHAALSLGLAYANARTLMAHGLSNFHLYGLNNTRLLLPLIASLKALDTTTKH